MNLILGPHIFIVRREGEWAQGRFIVYSRGKNNFIERSESERVRGELFFPRSLQWWAVSIQKISAHHCVRPEGKECYVHSVEIAAGVHTVLTPRLHPQQMVNITCWSRNYDALPMMCTQHIIERRAYKILGFNMDSYHLYHLLGPGPTWM